MKRILDFEKQKLPVTGIFEVLRNSRRASRDPRVEACTKTPRSFTLIEFSAESSLLETKNFFQNEVKAKISLIVLSHIYSGFITNRNSFITSRYFEKDIISLSRSQSN